jgi:Flp pilus assembly protein TadD
MFERFPQENIDILSAKQEAIRLFDSGKLGLAARRFRDILARAPEDAQVKANLALALSYTGPEGEREAIWLLEETSSEWGRQ